MMRRGSSVVRPRLFWCGQPAAQCFGWNRACRSIRRLDYRLCFASLRFALVAEIPRRPLRFGWKLDGQNRYWEPKKRVSGQRGKRSELLQQSEGSSSQSMQGPQ